MMRVDECSHVTITASKPQLKHAKISSVTDTVFF